MKHIQKIVTPTGEALRIYDRHNQPFLMQPESQVIESQKLYLKIGLVMGVCGAIGATVILSTLLNLFQPRYPVQPATYQQSPVNGVV